MSMTKLAKARKSSGFSQNAAAAIIGKSTPTYCWYEKEPEKMRLGDFFALYREMGKDEREVMWGQLRDLAS